MLGIFQKDGNQNGTEVDNWNCPNNFAKICRIYDLYWLCTRIVFPWAKINKLYISFNFIYLFNIK